MSEPKKPVDCVCGAKVDVGDTVICARCDRRGPWQDSFDEATEAWNRDMRALKHFTPVFNALGVTAFDPCTECQHPSSEACRKSCHRWERYEKANATFEAACEHRQ
ncbi:unnamed protein product [marine sediment metagenome]|uniref:Uncharacterized protein n=1 Tax=marine sediment metagenome TaxID=412755 RepID=X0S8Q9_9ZZZZ